MQSPETAVHCAFCLYPYSADKSVLQALDEATETLAVNNKVINALQNQVRLKSLYAYLKTLIVDGRVPKETFALVFDKVKLDGK
jgi:hypothetical protein